MTTRQPHGLAAASAASAASSASAASAAVLLICAASAAAAQQPASATPPSSAAAADAPSNPTTAPAQRQPVGTNPPQLLLRDALGAAKPAGFNPSFSPNGQRFVQQDGGRLYQAICQGCHMPQGQGAKGAGFYPALANNARLAAGTYPAYVVLFGLRGMPPFAGRLSDQQVAAVVNHVRTNLGNNHQDAVTPEAVKALRPQQER